MRIVVKGDTCVGSGNCAYTASEFFEQEPDLGTVVIRRTEVSADRQELVRRASELCPVQAIVLVED